VEEIMKKVMDGRLFLKGYSLEYLISSDVGALIPHKGFFCLLNNKSVDPLICLMKKASISRIVIDAEDWYLDADEETFRNKHYNNPREGSISKLENKGNVFLGMNKTLNPHFQSQARDTLAVFTNDPGAYAAEEIFHPEKCTEGAKRQTWVNRYERSVKARNQCIAALCKDGIECKVCGFDFEEKYGELGTNYIQVHHLIPLSEIDEEYEVDPIKDLIPVCANCHAMFHRKRDKILSVKELQDLVKTRRK